MVRKDGAGVNIDDSNRSQHGELPEADGLPLQDRIDSYSKKTAEMCLSFEK